MTLRLVAPADEEPDQEALESVQPRTNDHANAIACRDAFGMNFRFASEWECWLGWTGTHWSREGARLKLFGAVVAQAQREYAETLEDVERLTREIPKVAFEHGVGSDQVKKLQARLAAAETILKWHSNSQNTGKVQATITQLESVCACSFTELDRNPWLLNCRNGTVDLKTAELRAHDRADLITCCLELPYDAAARAPTWDGFLRQCMHGEPLLVLYLQRLVGYTLTASAQEHLLMFCYGTGANGKSTFFRVLSALLGPYGTAMPRTLLFTSRPGEVHPTELATLHGKRLGICSEIGEDVRLDEAKIKDLTGGDAISCRRMKEDFWQFTPTHTLWLAGNHKPTITGTDDGIWRRLHVVPWTISFTPDQQDKALSAKLQLELPGVLAWAVAGCLEWQRIGMADPPEVTDATAEYRLNSDVVGDFFRLRLVFEPEGRMTAKALRTAYETWCEELGHAPVGARRLAQRLRSHGVKPVNIRVDGRFANGWAGVRMLAEFEAPAELPTNA